MIMLPELKFRIKIERLLEPHARLQILLAFHNRYTNTIGMHSQ